MKLVHTFGRSAKAAQALLESLEQRGAVSTGQVEPVVRRILADVRQLGDAALRKYAKKFYSHSISPAMPRAVPSIMAMSNPRRDSKRPMKFSAKAAGPVSREKPNMAGRG